MELLVKRLHPEARLPARATPGSAGLDLCARLDDSIVLPPGGRMPIPTGIAVGVPAGYAGLVYARSGLAIRHGISLANGVGVIDSDYTGELVVGLVNQSSASFAVEDGMRIAQLVLAPVAPVTVAETDELAKTARGDGGLGSTGLGNKSYGGCRDEEK